MAEPVTIARPYAEAVFKLAKEKDALAAWTAALGLLAAVVGDPRVRHCIGDPKVGATELEGLILGVVGDEIEGGARNLVQVLIQNGRLDLVPHIAALYEELRREHEGILEAKIISGLPVNDEQVRQLVARLEAKYKRKVSAQVEIDPQLIGGVKIVIGDQVIDATVRGRLEAMAAALIH